MRQVRCSLLPLCRASSSLSGHGEDNSLMHSDRKRVCSKLVLNSVNILFRRQDFRLCKKQIYLDFYYQDFNFKVIEENSYLK